MSCYIATAVKKVSLYNQRISQHGREMRSAYKILVGKPESKRLLRKCRHRWGDIRMDLREMGWEGVDCIHLSQDRDQWWFLVNMVMNL
jgi:hypothetical protein